MLTTQTRRLALRGAVLAAALALALPALGPAAPPPLADDLKYIPPDSDLLMVLHLDTIAASPAVKQLRKDQTRFDKVMDQVPREFGVAAADIECLTAVGRVMDAGLFIVRTNKAVKAADVEAALKQPRFDGDKAVVTYKPAKIGDYTLYEPDQEYRQAFCLVNDRTILVSAAKDLKPILERKAAPEVPAGLRKGLAQVDQKATLYFVAASKAAPVLLGGWWLGPGGAYPGNVDARKMWADAEAVTGSLTLGDKEVIGAMGAVCKDDKAAAALKADGDKVREALIAAVKDKNPPPGLLAFLNQIKPETAGAVVRGRMTLKNEDAETIFKALFFPSPKPSGDRGADKPNPER